MQPSSARPDRRPASPGGRRPPTPSSGRAGRDWGGGRGTATPSRPPPPTTVDTPTATATRAALAKLGARAKRSLGQNFVVDEGVLAAVADAAAVGPGDGVLEVGPGTGNLTRRLLATGAAVTAVEKDDALYGLLCEELGDHPNLRLVHGDILRVHLPDELALLAVAAERSRGGGGDSEAPPSPRLSVVANLPYNITGDALRLLLPASPPLTRVLLMLQADAAERYSTSTPASPAWRGATVLARHYSVPKLLFRIPSCAYYPAPRVESAVVSFDLTPLSSRPPVDDRTLRTVVTAAFNQRRKALRNSVAGLLGGDGVAAAAAVAAAGLEPDARADAVSVAGFVALANAVAAVRQEVQQ